MSNIRSTFRTLFNAGLNPDLIKSYAGSSLLVAQNGEKYAFDPKGDPVPYWQHQEQQSQNELAWSFSFIRPVVQNLLRRCQKIIVVGPSTDYYKIYFFTDDYRCFKIELKRDAGHGLDNVIPKSFSTGGKRYYDELTSYELSQAVTPSEAGQLLSNCPYQPASIPNALVFRWVKYLLGHELMGQADKRIATASAN